ncbi:MAG TPA: chaperone NapD [Hyphomicrobiaceae bacterium]|nr:chaperone NapD [Hyphomicrobiaceae bacterium]
MPTRRDVISRPWSPAQPTQQARRQVEIVSLIVSSRPQHLDSVAEAILALGNAELHGRDPKGKLIVVLEANSAGAIGAKVNQISDLPHVLSAVMVFQATDDDDATS